MSPAATEGRARVATGERRRLIVDAADDLIAERGLAATNAREIAAAAGISLGTLTYHFDSVEEILMQVLWAQTEAFEQRRSAHVTADMEPRERVVAFLCAYLDPEVHPRSMWRLWLDCWSRATRDSELRRWQVARYHHVYDELERLLEEGMLVGQMPTLAARECARELMALVDGLGEQVLIDDELTAEQSQSILRDAIVRRLSWPAAREERV